MKIAMFLSPNTEWYSRQKKGDPFTGGWPLKDSFALCAGEVVREFKLPKPLGLRPQRIVFELTRGAVKPKDAFELLEHGHVRRPTGGKIYAYIMMTTQGDIASLMARGYRWVRLVKWS